MKEALVTDFFREAHCVGMNPDIFFPEAGGSPEARKVCGGCPVQQECLTWALNEGEELGFWGGVSASRRKTLLETSRVEDWVPRVCVRCSGLFIPIMLGQAKCHSLCGRGSDGVN